MSQSSEPALVIGATPRAGMARLLSVQQIILTIVDREGRVLGCHVDRHQGEALEQEIRGGSLPAIRFEREKSFPTCITTPLRVPPSGEEFRQVTEAIKQHIREACPDKSRCSVEQERHIREMYAFYTPNAWQLRFPHNLAVIRERGKWFEAGEIVQIEGINGEEEVYITSYPEPDKFRMPIKTALLDICPPEARKEAMRARRALIRAMGEPGYPTREWTRLQTELTLIAYYLGEENP